MLGGTLSLFDAPSPVQAAGGGLRPYQQEAVTAILEKLRAHRSTLLVLATAGGKTTVFGEVINRWQGRVLVLAHREELLTQARARVQDITGELVGLEQAEAWAGNERIVVGSVQTLVSDKRLRRFAADPFTLIVVDECHHATSKSYRKILAAFPGAKILGVTATPDRGDGRAMGMVFESVAYERRAEQLIADGYLVRALVQDAFVTELDLSAVHVERGDFAEGELEDAVTKAVAPIAHAALQYAGARPTIVFTPGVQSAHMVAEAINKERPSSAAAVDGTTDKFLRRRIFGDLKVGRLQFLVNCGVATEGTDLPTVACVVIARKTKSRALYAQMAGRGLRVLPGLVEGIEDAAERCAAIAGSAKPDCLIVDITGKGHDLNGPVGMVEVLGGRYDDETKARAKKKLAEGEKDVSAALAAAAREVERERISKAAAAAAKARVKFEAIARDPFKALGVSRGDWNPSGMPPEPCTAHQRDWLRRELGMSFSEAKKCSKREAGRLIAAEKARLEKGLCGTLSVRELARFGIDARKAPLESVRRLRKEFDANGGRMPAPERIKEILGRVPGMEG